MSGRHHHDAHCGEDVASYALGALPAEEVRGFERHLSHCELCQTDLESLRPAVDALPMSVESVEPPPELRRRIMAEVDADVKRRRAAARADRGSRFAFRPLPAMAAACALLVGGVAVGVAVNDEPRERSRVVRSADAPRGTSAKLEVRGGNGTLVVDDMPKAPVGRVYQVWLRRPGGSPEPTDALFEVRRDGKAKVAVPGDLDDVQQVLVTHEPRGGSSVPTQTPAITVSL